MGYLILTSILSTLLPLAVGAFLAILLRKKNDKILDAILLCSSGTIMALLCFDLFPEIYENLSSTFNNYAILVIIAGIVVFVSLLFLLHYLFEKIFHAHHHHEHDEEEEKHDHGHISMYVENRKTSLRNAGIALVLALFFHNFPEGMSLGIVFKGDMNEGIRLAIFLGLHNLVMGLTMTLPLILSNMNKVKAFLIVILSSLPSILGSILGYSSFGISENVDALVMLLSASVLIFVIIEELTPYALKKGKRLWVIIFFLLGFALSCLLHFLG